MFGPYWYTFQLCHCMDKVCFPVSNYINSFSSSHYSNSPLNRQILIEKVLGLNMNKGVWCSFGSKFYLLKVLTNI